MSVEHKSEGFLLEATDLRKSFVATSGAFGGGARRINAVDGVSLKLVAGETLAIVGESGSGKTTLARLLLRLEEPDAGSVRCFGEDLLAARGARLRALRREMQMVFQDPYASLDPRMDVEAIVSEPLAIHEPRMSRSDRRARVTRMLGTVGLGPDSLARYPHEFSGGQRQRVGIARALVLRPKLIVADEPVSALERIGGRADIVAAAGVAGRIRADVSHRVAQFAGGGAACDAHRGDEVRASD